MNSLVSDLRMYLRYSGSDILKAKCKCTHHADDVVHDIAIARKSDLSALIMGKTELNSLCATQYEEGRNKSRTGRAQR